MGKAEQTQNPASEELFSVEPGVELVAVNYMGKRVIVPRQVLDDARPVISCHSDGRLARINENGYIECTASGYCLSRKGNGKRACTYWEVDPLICIKGAVRCCYWTSEDVKRRKTEASIII